MKLKIGDTVLVTTGKDKGRRGKVDKIWTGLGGQVVVTGMNQYKRHVKRRGEKAGGIVTLERPLALAKVALVCPKCNRPTRVGYTLGKTAGQKQRVCRKCGEAI